MRKICRLMCLILAAALLAALLAGCRDTGARQQGLPVVFSSYHDIPGLTDSDKEEIAALLRQRDYFIYGMMLSTEAFIDSDGELRGFSAHVCDWLTGLFGVRFVPEIFTWESLRGGLADGRVDFTGTMVATEERRSTYMFTEPLAQRTMMYVRMTEREPLSEIMETRLPRYALLEGSVSAGNVIRYAIDEFEPVFISEYSDAYELLRSGKIDALFAESSSEATFAAYNDLTFEDTLPIILAPVSLTAQNPELGPIINAVQKAIENGGGMYLNSLYETGQQEYRQHKLFIRLSDAELEYIGQNRVIPIAVDHRNYPISFFSDRGDNGWHGICIDVLREIEQLTSLEFDIINDEKAGRDELFQMLERGDIFMLSNEIKPDSAQGSFLLTNNSYISEKPVLISKADLPNISVNRVHTRTVGLTADSVFTDYFNKVFPNQPHKIVYNDQEAAFDALENGSVDMLMCSFSAFLYLINYMELQDYKVNIMFDAEIEARFAINTQQRVLRSIVDKALDQIDTTMIAEQWNHRTYNYLLKLSEARLPWIIGASALLLAVLALIVVLLARRHRVASAMLELSESKMKIIESEALRMAAETASYAKSAFLSTMSHEIRTPMNAILGITEIQLQNEKLDAGVRESIEMIYASGELLLGIINDILDLSKIEAGKLELLIYRFEVAGFISDVAQLNMTRIGSKSIEFELYVDENMPASLLGDELRVKQILNNILSNAFKYTTAGTVKMTVTTEDSKESDEEVILVVCISDTGQGMTQQQIGRLFDEYSQFNKEANLNSEGTGLGMSITRNLIRLMDGRITVESEVGKGSSFTVSLPQGRVDSEILGKEMSENLHLFRTSSKAQMKRIQISREPMPYGRVLVVDDVETNIYVAKGLLSPYELSIDSAESGVEAVEKVKSGKIYDIIFMDHMMPEMDGVEATRRLREIGYSAPVVALTANAVAGQAGIFLGSGFDDFISKPIDIRQLNIVLNRFIRDKQPPEVLEKARIQAESRGGGHDSPVRQEPDNELVEIFIRDAEKALVTLDELVEIGALYGDDLRSYAINMHGMKSALLNLGKMYLSAVALRLERSARDGSTEVLVSETPAFISSLRTLLGELKHEGDGSADGDVENMGFGEYFGEVTSEEGALVSEPVKAGLRDSTVEGLDITEGLQRYDNNERVYIRILRSYTVSVRSMLEEIETVSEDTLRDYKIKVHGIKGVSFDIFATEIAKDAAQLEKASAAGDIDYVHQHHAKFLEDAWRLVSSVETMLSGISDESNRPVKNEIDRELLSGLLNACKSYDMDGADAVMDEIEKFRYESDSGLYDVLRDGIDMMDFSKIVGLLSDIL